MTNIQIILTRQGETIKKTMAIKGINTLSKPMKYQNATGLKAGEYLNPQL